MKLKKGDNVIVITGKDKGKKGKVVSVLVSKNKVVVEGLNLMIKHQRPKKQGEKGQRIQFPAPINSSKVALICPKCQKQTRVGFSIEGKNKVRVCKKCKGVIS